MFCLLASRIVQLNATNRTDEDPDGKSSKRTETQRGVVREVQLGLEKYFCVRVRRKYCCDHQTEWPLPVSSPVPCGCGVECADHRSHLLLDQHSWKHLLSFFYLPNNTIISSLSSLNWTHIFPRMQHVVWWSVSHGWCLEDRKMFQLLAPSCHFFVEMRTVVDGSNGVQRSVIIL